jgi:choice-of-anchor A domain-containing protein
MNDRRIALFLLPLGLISCTTAIARAESVLGVASAYNLVALGNGSTAGNITDSSDVGGRVAAAGTVDLASVAQSLVNDPYASLAGSYLLVADGGVASGDNIHVMATGNAFAPGATAGNFSFNAGGSLVTTGLSPINFTSLSSTLDAESLYLGALLPTGQVIASGQPGFPGGANPSWLALVGTNATLDIFNITAAQLASINNPLDIVVPAGATVIINVSGTSDSLARRSTSTAPSYPTPAMPPQMSCSTSTMPRRSRSMRRSTDRCWPRSPSSPATPRSTAR